MKTSRMIVKVQHRKKNTLVFYVSIICSLHSKRSHTKRTKFGPRVFNSFSHSARAKNGPRTKGGRKGVGEGK